MTRTLPLAALAAFTLATPSAMAGDGSFRAGETLEVGATESIAVGDFNADGRPDLAAAPYTGNFGVVHHGKPGGGFTVAPPVSVGEKPSEVVAADFDGDGDDDLAIGARTKVVIRMSSGNGNYTSSPDISIAGAFFRTMAAGDFDGDGRIDLAITVASTTGNAIYLSLGSGDGKFATSVDNGISGCPLVVADLNSDGVQDIVHGNLGSSKTGGVLLGTGLGKLAAGQSIALPDSANARRSWATGDFNSDGHVDAAVAISASRVASVRFGRGDGTFAAGPDVPAGDYPVAIAVGDVNSDGNDDLVIADGTDSPAAVRLGDGAGSFTAAPDVATGAGSYDIAIADLDGDGNDDLAIPGGNEGTIAIHYGTGPAALAGNLLTNGGFEGAGAAGTVGQTPEIPGWSRRGQITFARYGLGSSAFFPTLLAAPRFGTGGSSLLWGGNSAGTDGVTEAFQVVDVVATAEHIDAGRATANLSAYLGGALAYNDRAEVRADFLPAAGDQAIGTLKIGPVTVADRKQLTTLLRRAGSAPVPAGTRRIGVAVTSIDDDKTLSSATADNVKLTLDITPPPTPTPTQTPDPSATPGPGATPGPSPVTVSLRGRTARIANGNAFAVDGALTGRAIKRARFTVAATSTTRVRLALRPRAKRTLRRRGRLTLRVTAVVRGVRSRHVTRINNPRRTK